MQVVDIKRLLRDIRKEDDEKAHILEDKMFVMVLKAVASGTENAQALAKEALKSQKINFCRWYA